MIIGLYIITLKSGRKIVIKAYSDIITTINKIQAWASLSKIFNEYGIHTPNFVCRRDSSRYSVSIVDNGLQYYVWAEEYMTQSTLDDIVENEYEKSIEEMYTSLCNEDIERMKAYVINLIEDEDIEMAQDILLSIVCYTNVAIEECLRALLKKNECYPDIIFKDASVDVRDYLIEQVSKGSDTLSLNHILRALAWIGDEKVINLFYEWKKNPPKWRNKLYIPLEEYSLESGWELTEDGERRDLFYTDCYAIEKKNHTKDEPILFLQTQDKKCEWCRGDLVNLFSFDLTNSLFEFVNLNGVRLNIVTCHVCNCYGPIYTNTDTNGAVHWSELNIKPQYLCDATDEEAITPKEPIRISRVKRNCYHAASQFLETTFSQIGGHPTWIQDAEYPKCPRCSKHMKFIGQIDWADIEEYGEGMYYAFICEECNIAATHFQQS